MWDRCDGVWHLTRRDDCPSRYGEPTAFLHRRIRTTDGGALCVDCLGSVLDEHVVIDEPLIHPNGF